MNYIASHSIHNLQSLFNTTRVRIGERRGNMGLMGDSSKITNTT